MNNQEFDERMEEIIRERLHKEEPKLPESFEKRIDDILRQLPEEDEQPWYVKTLVKVAAFACAVLVVMTAPYAMAGVRAYITHLSEMSQDEMDKLSEGVQLSGEEADQYSRELTQTERERINELREQYKDGTCYPEECLKQVENESSRTEGEFCFCVQNSTYYLPEGEMSEEQLRQIVDFQYRREYSLDKSHDAEPFKVTETPEEISGTEEKSLAARGKEVLAELYGIDAEGAEYELELDGQQAAITYGKKDWTYDVQVHLERDGLKMMEVLVSDKEDTQTREGIPADEKALRGHVTEVREMAGKLTSEKISKIAMKYFYTKDHMLYRDQISYYVVCADGSGYQITYSESCQKIVGISYLSDAEAFIEVVREQQQQNESLSDEGITQRLVILDE